MEDRFIGKRLDGRYEIHDLVGVGGMAYVYRAYDRLEDRWVAIKILKEEYSKNNDFLRRFRNESKAIAVLSHPNIVRIFDVSLGDQIQYIVMEFIDGITLKDYIEQQGVIRWQETVHFMAQVLDALESAHQKGIIHRDIKPQNIILLRDGKIKVTDFGIARFQQSDTQTMTDKAIGSVHYISPEQARGDYITNKADIYSTGVMMYEMLTGELPFNADNAVSVALMQLQNKPEMPSVINPSIPKGLEQITIKAMEKNPANRFESAGKMLDDLERFRADPTTVFSYRYMSSEYKEQKRDVANYETVGRQEEDYDDNYEYEEEYVKSKRRRKGSMVIKGIIIAIILVALSVGAVYAVNFISDMRNSESSDVTVPDFVGKDYATEIANNDQYNNFQIKIEQGNNPAYGPGIVIRQDPQPGKVVRRNREIVLTINPTGETSVTVPSLSGYTRDEAVDELKALKLSSNLQLEFHDSVEDGYVIRVDPLEGSIVSEGTVVTVYVSKGPAKKRVEVPDGLTGKKLEDVKTLIIDAGLSVGSVTEDPLSKEEKDTVISVTPASGTKISEGQPVDIVVSSGKGTPKTVGTTIELPNVDEDIVVRVYRDGAKEEEKTVNPAYNSTYDITFTGTGTANVVVELNGQEYMVMKFDFDALTADTIKQNEYNSGSNASSETSSESSEE